MSELLPLFAALRLDRAVVAFVAPVPPYATAIGVPFHVPAVMVLKLRFPVAESDVKYPACGLDAPIVTPSIVPPEIVTLLAFWVDIVPKPVTWVFAIKMGTFAAAVN